MPLVSIKFIMSQLLLAIHFNPPQVMQDKKKKHSHCSLKAYSTSKISIIKEHQKECRGTERETRH